MSTAPFPPVRELVPQSGAMCLLSRVLFHDSAETRCAVEVADSELFQDEHGCVGAWLSLEWMAQCVAVHGGLAARAEGEAPRPGLLLGARRLQLAARDFRAHERFEVRARHVARDARLDMFACQVESEDGAVLAEGRLSVYTPSQLGELLHAR